MSESDSAATDEEDDEIEMLRLDPPRKAHVVEERPSPSVAVTACGLRFEQPGGIPISTFSFDPEKPAHEKIHTRPVPKARCGNCPWESRLE